MPICHSVISRWHGVRSWPASAQIPSGMVGEVVEAAGASHGYTVGGLLAGD